MNLPQPAFDVLHGELRQLIEVGRQRAAATVNAELTRLYWSVGKRLRDEVLSGERATYGPGIVEQLGVQLSGEFGRGFEAKNLRRMMQFAEAFPAPEIVATLSRQLNWSHMVTLLPIKNEQQRAFYAHMAVTETWSVRELRRRIKAKTFERTALASTQGQGIENEAHEPISSFQNKASERVPSLEKEASEPVPPFEKGGLGGIFSDSSSPEDEVEE